MGRGRTWKKTGAGVGTPGGRGALGCRRASKGGKRGGRSRPQVELSGLKAQLQDLTRDVLVGDRETGRATVANQLINSRHQAVKLERKIKETDVLEARLEELEQTAEKKGGSRWGPREEDWAPGGREPPSYPEAGEEGTWSIRNGYRIWKYRK